MYTKSYRKLEIVIMDNNYYSKSYRANELVNYEIVFNLQNDSTLALHYVN